MCPLRVKLNNGETPFFGVGSNNPKIIIVISPITREFSPLVDGLSLEFLERWLAVYSISKTDVYITPYVKCRTKTITKKSTEQCCDWLKNEIEFFKPKAVFILAPKSHFKFIKYPQETIPVYEVQHSLHELSTNFKTTPIANNLFKAMKDIISK